MKSILKRLSDLYSRLNRPTDEVENVDDSQLERDVNGKSDVDHKKDEAQPDPWDYTSDSLDQLTEQYPVESVLGLAFESFKDFKDNAMNYASYFRSSPAQSSHAEKIIGMAMTEAAKKDRWVGWDVGLKPQYLETFEANKAAGRLNDFERGMARALDTGLFGFEIEDGKVYLVPKEPLLQFVRDRTQSYANKGE